MVSSNASLVMRHMGHLPGQNNKHDWKYYHFTTSLASGTNVAGILTKQMVPASIESHSQRSLVYASASAMTQFLMPGNQCHHDWIYPAYISSIFTLGQRPGMGSMGYNILCRNIYCGLRLRQGQGQGLGSIVSYCASPIPCTAPNPGPMQCEWAISV